MVIGRSYFTSVFLCQDLFCGTSIFDLVTLTSGLFYLDFLLTLTIINFATIRRHLFHNLILFSEDCKQIEHEIIHIFYCKILKIPIRSKYLLFFITHDLIWWVWVHAHFWKLVRYKITLLYVKFELRGRGLCDFRQV